MRRLYALIGGIALLVAELVTSPTAGAAPTILDIPVAFTVTNVNHSAVPCGSNGKTYTIRGHVTGPASVLASASPSATLYLHGLELGEWFWRLPVAGYDYAAQMAALGHVSVTIDRLGYDNSSQPPGTGICVGSQADIAHQIVSQLRAGTYTGSVHPRIARIALAGHSLGGSIAQIEAYSFKDIQALAVLSYAETAPTPAALTETLTWGPKCLQGGATSEAGAPGYAYFTGSVADYRANFLAHAPAAVLSAALPRRDLNPCGDLMSVLNPVAVSALHLRDVTVPVLLLAGSQDKVFDASRLPLQRLLYSGSKDVTVQIINGATHGLTLEPTAATFQHDMDVWLKARGF